MIQLNWDEVDALRIQGINWNSIKATMNGVNWSYVESVNGINWQAVNTASINWYNWPIAEAQGTNWSTWINNGGQ